MKKLKYLLMVLVCALMVSGCEMKYDIDMEVTKDGDVSLDIIIAYDKELLSSLLSLENMDAEGNIDENAPEPTEEDMKAWLKEAVGEQEVPEGVTMEEYVEGEYLGYIISASQHIDEITTTKDVEYDLTDTEEVTGKMFTKKGNKYVANFKFNSDSLMGEMSTEDNEELDTYMNMLDFNFTYSIKLPNKPLSHNATDVSEDGKTLTWDLKSSGLNDIKFEFELEEGSFIKDNLTYILLGAAAIVIIVVIIIARPKKPKADPIVTTANTNTPVMETPTTVTETTIPQEQNTENIENQ